MNKTLLNHFTVISPDHQAAATQKDILGASLHELVSDMQEVLVHAEQELLSPRPEAIKQLLQKALLY